ncbi:MAG: zinc metallopeptidase [Syntrophomonadaceae bacterium]|nr:zinc metallopeptidase [Syntrophomonadaceae bacterium]
MLPFIIIAIYAQIKVKTTFNRYSKVKSSRGITGAQAASELLSRNGLSRVRVEPIGGSLSDHYDPSSGVVRLSETVYGNNSIAALGVAAHEVGHAVQHQQKYGALEIRNSIVPVTNFASSASYFVILAGIILQSADFMLIGIILFSAVVFFHVVTLPVELNASRRAVFQLRDTGLITTEEVPMVKKVLGAAAMTYLAAVLSSIATLFYYIMMFSGGSDD